MMIPDQSVPDSLCGDQPHFTTVVAIDEEHLSELRLVWPTWQLHRSEVMAHPLLVICDAAIPQAKWEQELGFLGHAQSMLVSWQLDDASQREKMLNGFVFAVARHVNTPWYLKLDTDAVAVKSANWIDRRWFMPDREGRLPSFIASPWGYTKPGDAIERLDKWGDGIAELSQYPRLDLRAAAGSSIVAHPRIISWCFFGRTDSTRQAAAMCGGRLPVPSQDTFLWYVAKRRGEFFRRATMKKYGWAHASGRKRLKQLCQTALREPAELSLPRDKRRAPSKSVVSALARIVAALVPSFAKGALVDTIGNVAKAAFDRQRSDWQLSVLFSSDFAGGSLEATPVQHVQQGVNEQFDFVILEGETRFNELTRQLEYWWSRLRPGGMLAGINIGHTRDLRGLWGVRRALEGFARPLQTDLILPGRTMWILPKLRPFTTDNLSADHEKTPPLKVSSTPERLAVITCFFNPADDARLNRNYHRFAAFLESQNVAVWTVEIAFQDSAFELRKSERVLQLRTGSRLWQKERALNRLVQMLPANYNAVAWVDCDVLFEDRHWTTELCHRLEQFPLVQCWSHAKFLDETAEVTELRQSAALVANQNRPDQQSFYVGHPGLAWAARRSLIAANGLYDRHITGGGDSLMAIASFGWWRHRILNRLPPAMRSDFIIWAQGWWKGVTGTVGVLNGTVRHLWHGATENRLYRERWDWLKRLDFDPAKDITLDEHGLWRWTGRNARLERCLPAYFRWLRDSDSAKDSALAQLTKSTDAIS